MVDIVDGLKVLGDIAQKSPNPPQAFADLHTVYALFQDVQTHGLDLAEMDKAGTLQAEADALARSTAMLAKLVADKGDKQALIAFVASLNAAKA